MSDIAFYEPDWGYMKLMAAGYMIPMDRSLLNELSINHMFSTEDATLYYLQNKYLQQENGSFIDIGANVGVYTMALAFYFDKVYAFEPFRHAYNCMCGNIAIHDLSHKVETFNIGLYNDDLILPFHFTDMTGSNNFFNTTDPETNKALAHSLVNGDIMQRVVPLDNYKLTNISLIKIDTEGTELQVLQGAQRTIIENNYPEIIFESWDPEDRSKATGTPIEALEKLRQSLFDYITDMGYEITNIERDTFSAIHK